MFLNSLFQSVWRGYVKHSSYTIYRRKKWAAGMLVEKFCFHFVLLILKIYMESFVIFFYCRKVYSKFFIIYWSTVSWTWKADLRFSKGYFLFFLINSLFYLLRHDCIDLDNALQIVNDSVRDKRKTSRLFAQLSVKNKSKNPFIDIHISNNLYTIFRPALCRSSSGLKWKRLRKSCFDVVKYWRHVIATCSLGCSWALVSKSLWVYTDCIDLDRPDCGHGHCGDVCWSWISVFSFLNRRNDLSFQYNLLLVILFCMWILMFGIICRYYYFLYRLSVKIGRK